MSIDILTEIKSRGYEEEPQIIIPAKPIIDLSRTIDTYFPNILRPEKSSLKINKNSTIDFYETFFKLQRVPFFSEKKYGPFKAEKQGDVHPFGLPIIKVKNTDSLYGSLNEVLFNPSTNKELFYKGISLSKNQTELSKLAYTHEIAHSQLNHVKGIIENYYDTEVISIFLELVHALEADTTEQLLENHDTVRLQELSSIIKELDKYHFTIDPETRNILIEASLYFESTLKAYNLFARYYFGSFSAKRAILQEIQKLFNQETSLNPLLDKFDISSEPNISKLTMTRYIKR